ncbi:MAG: SDR family oxidoreductase [Deltaproteobacteria bacterium]|nr:SDR family oxidoreductase [Deltaproteobacteria bacterium]
MNKRLAGKVALITGGAQGLGRACATAMANEGCRVVIADIDMAKAEEAVQQIHAAGSEAIAVKTDVSDPEQAIRLAGAAMDRFGKIDILFNNAALVSRGAISRVPFYELSLAEWNRVIAVNLTGSFLCCRAVFPYMRAQGGGKIINVASGQFFQPVATYAHYIASKGGIVGLTRALAKEMGEFHINVNCVVPGGLIAEQVASEEELRSRQNAASRRAIKRIENADDVVGTIMFLASGDSDFITGQTLVIDGGAVMH